jgi:3-oxoacyl-[acyl-carrier protein] reductase
MTDDPGTTRSPGVAVVTGGAKGIGLAISRALARDGYRVAVCGRDAAALDRACTAIGDGIPGGAAFPVVMDVTDAASVAAGFARDRTGTYTVAWFSAAMLCVVAAVISLRVRPQARSSG